jgi:hypothetical protein
MTLILAFLLATATLEEGPSSPAVDWLGPRGANGPAPLENEYDEMDDNYWVDPYSDAMVMGFNEVNRMAVI